ncbi:hypothetical protein NQ317_002196 [Molorchus minor]|uniref:Odorant receptor n=1 Tax=Molorchus minor TaxID=1323400 RepID=A0ABQ9JMF8_9CUCU|nr:hypothetical protein NQ317_002196 [Molorchus minor]
MTSMEEEFDLHQAFNFEKIQLLTGGFYPSNNKKPNVFQKLSFIINFGIALLQFATSIAFLLFHRDDLTNFSEVLLFSMTQLSYIVKLSVFLSEKDNVIKIDHKLKDPLFNVVTKTEKHILTSVLRNGRMVTNFYKILCFASTMFYLIFPLLDGSQETKTFPLPGWFPFNPHNYYLQVYLFEWLGIASCAWFGSTLDCLPAIMMAMGKAQFEVLKYRLINITRHVNELDHRLVERRLRKMRFSLCRGYQVLKSSYSYFTVLYSIYNSNDGEQNRVSVKISEVSTSEGSATPRIRTRPPQFPVFEGAEHGANVNFSRPGLKHPHRPKTTPGRGSILVTQYPPVRHTGSPIFEDAEHDGAEHRIGNFKTNRSLPTPQTAKNHPEEGVVFGCLRGGQRAMGFGIANRWFLAVWELAGNDWVVFGHLEGCQGAIGFGMATIMFIILENGRSGMSDRWILGNQYVTPSGGSFRPMGGVYNPVEKN